MKETPSISSSCYTSSGVNPWQNLSQNQIAMGQALFGNAEGGLLGQLSPDTDAIYKSLNINKQTMANTSIRIVQVFIADTNENVPLDQSVLFKGEQKLTDLTDTELFFEVPMAEILKAHNDKRVTWADKEASKRSGKDVLLDPVKIRDLKMVVVTVAQF